MTTAAKLESLTDRSQFERLATSVLRKAEPKYSTIIQTGVNAQGETIVAPIDGLLLIPHSDPAHYVFVQHTTTDRDGLRRKWLSERDGDLFKASTEALNVRQRQPDAVFTVVLTTNQRVDPKLFQDVCERAQTAHMVVDIWEQSRLADFLDTTQDGQWLRKSYLGVEAERLSTLHRSGIVSDLDVLRATRLAEERKTQMRSAEFAARLAIRDLQTHEQDRIARVAALKALCVRTRTAAQ